MSKSTKGIWKVITASSMGTLIEWYDFYIFGSLAVVISTKFFPADNPTAAFLSTLATFAAGFVVNMATESNVEKMNLTSAAVAPEVDEFELAGLTPIASVKVKPARVAESPIAFECQLVHHYTLENHNNGGATILIGKIVMFHIDESVWLGDFKIDMQAYKPVARLAGANYCKLGEIFTIKRPS